jgi:transcription initiation factor TFIIA large subunit
MSNQIVGQVYEQIIKKVILASHNDFEEFGVEQATLEEMQQGWQDKLSSLKIAQFPWDPQPEPVRQPPTVPSNVKQESDITPTSAASQDQHNFPNIKTERGYEPSLNSYPAHPNGGYTSGLDGNLAQQRANQLVAQRLGQTGNGNMPLQGMNQHQGQPHMTGQQQRMPIPYQNQMPRQGERLPQRPANVVRNSQTDGADDALEDWKALVAARRAAEADDGPDGRIAADHLMRAQVDAMALRQDSGLLVPLDEMPKGKRRKAAIKVVQQQMAASSVQGVPSNPGVSGFDGKEEDDDKDDKTDDEDAINSDLDDPEDDIDGDGEGDDDNIDYMLCTYDKVQRVKNKWKCTLKDGILTTNKKEFLFHKATGEFEW